MNCSSLKPTKQELLDDYARHEPQQLLQFDGKVAGYGNDADRDGHDVSVQLSNELMDVSGVRVLIPRGISTREAVALLRKIAEMIETTDAGLKRIYEILAFPPNLPGDSLLR